MAGERNPHEVHHTVAECAIDDREEVNSRRS
jgi:hypothetical protein